ncbi:Holliday junction branch migration protein RuvA [Tomitella biformata]|uniref:Holliday junction branch migration protein RuvA n=1 Tax=Tomitella biformata TaxID=630403 RepID=UPI000463F18F|nr:Holliday junction branch migration protein RuvA [Tomitella biformata]
MISSIRGDVLHIGLDHVVLDVGGLGYRVNATPATLGRLARGTAASLVTTLVVREDSMTLYGFTDDESRALFSLVQTVSGIGPRLAMAITSVLEPDVLKRALVDEDIKVLQRVPGIGKRTAERMVLELKDKVALGADSDSGMAAGGSTGAHAKRDHVVEGLVGLGFGQPAAEAATDAVLKESPDAEIAAVLRSALTMLGRTK